MLMFHVNEFLLENNSQQSFHLKNNYIHFEFDLKCAYYSCLIKTNFNTSIQKGDLFFIRASLCIVKLIKQEKRYKIIFDYFLQINNETKIIEI
jgi:hypothetical protein